MDVSQIINGKLSLNLRWVDLISTVEAAIKTLAPAIGAKNIEIVTDFDKTAGRIFGDSCRLQQVAWNLLSNAIKFTPDGGRVRVALRRLEQTPVPEESACCKNLSPACVELEVSDTGQGITEEFLPHVFDRFSQADSSTRRSDNGLGLGFGLVRHFVEMHGGTVQAESAGKGQGASFLVRLPIKQPHSDCGLSVSGSGEFGVPQSQARARVNKSFVSSNLSGVRVLVVDLDADSLDFACTVLEDCGAQVETASSGMEALEAVERLNPDVLAIDIEIPALMERICSRKCASSWRTGKFRHWRSRRLVG